MVVPYRRVHAWSTLTLKNNERERNRCIMVGKRAGSDDIKTTSPLDKMGHTIEAGTDTMNGAPDDTFGQHDDGASIRSTEDIELECQDLAFTYPDSKVVFQGINLKVFKKELVAIIGPTGTGKSTLLRVIAHLISSGQGQVYLEGRPVNRPSPKIALIHQSIATFPWMTTLDNVKLGLRSAKIPDNEATSISENMLDMVGLKGARDMYPKEMSGGMRQRIAIARALAASPMVLLMDEPFVHLDELTAIGLRKEIYELLFNSETDLRSVILVSHNLHEVVQLADRVYIMNGAPATITNERRIDMPRPRSERDPSYLEYLDQLFHDLRPSEHKV